MTFKACVAALAALALTASASASSLQASEAVTVSVTLPVTVPLQVPAGQSFRDSALAFCEKNGLGQEHVEALEGALAARWNEMQMESMVVQQCASWQLQHAVVPTKSWGSLPAEAQAKWIADDCDGKVPSEPPTPLVTLDVKVDDTVLVLRAFEGDTLNASAERFCQAHGLDAAENVPVLVEALVAEVQRQRQQKQAATQEPRETQAQAQAQAQQTAPEPAERRFLFSIPFEVGGQLVRLRVYEGDDLDELVKVFCESQKLDIATAGPTVRQAIVDTSASVTAQLQREVAESQGQTAQAQAQAQERQPRADEQQPQAEAEEQQVAAVESPEDPKLLLDIPIQVDGAVLSMKLYDGDFVDRKIAAFCKEHGLDENSHGNLLLNHIKQRTEALA